MSLSPTKESNYTPMGTFLFAVQSVIIRGGRIVIGLPFEGVVIELEPHFVISFQFVSRRILVKQRLHLS